MFPELLALLQSLRTNSEAQFTPLARSTLEWVSFVLTCLGGYLKPKKKLESHSPLFGPFKALPLFASPATINFSHPYLNITENQLCGSNLSKPYWLYDICFLHPRNPYLSHVVDDCWWSRRRSAFWLPSRAKLPVTLEPKTEVLKVTPMTFRKNGIQMQLFRLLVAED
jgi:hypothetical protein